MKKAGWILGGLMLSLFLVGCGNNDSVNNTNPNGAVNNNQTGAGDANMDIVDNNMNDLDDMMDDDMNDDNDDMDMETDAVTEGDYEYSFQKFDLDVDYDDQDDAIEVEYENEPGDDFEASYEDKTKDIRLHGNEAMRELDKFFSKFDFDENTSEDEILDAVVEAFDIRNDARKIELEIEFNNGVEKEYRR